MLYYRAAAQDASSVYAWQESLILYTRILGLLNFVNKDLSNREDNRERGAILKETAFLNYLLDNFEARDRDLDYLRDLAQKTDDPVLELLHLQQRTRYDRLSGRFQDALDAANKGILLAGKLNNKTDQASLLVSVGFIYFLLGQPDTAIENLELARALTEEINDIGLHGQVIGRIGFIKSLLGQYREALQNIQEARDCQLKIGNTYAADDYMIEIGRWQSCLGMFSESQQTLMSMLEHTRKTQVRSDESHVLLALCGLYIATGKYSEALDMNQQALGILYNVQNQHLTVTAEVAMGVIFFHLGQYTHSRTWLEKSLESARSIHFSPRTAEVLVNLGLLEHASGNMELARKHIEEGIASARQSHYKEVIAAGLAALAVLERESGRLQEALNDIDEAFSLSAQIDFPACSMWAHAEASLVFSHLSRLDEALNHIQNAVDLIPVSDQSWVRSEQVYFIYSQILERAGRAEDAIEQRKLADAARQEKAALISDLELRNSFLSVKLQYL
jgi:tetratricopeptide (TPR) repeat protein